MFKQFYGKIDQALKTTGVFHHEHSVDEIQSCLICHAKAASAPSGLANSVPRGMKKEYPEEPITIGDMRLNHKQTQTEDNIITHELRRILD